MVDMCVAGLAGEGIRRGYSVQKARCQGWGKRAAWQHCHLHHGMNEGTVWESVAESAYLGRAIGRGKGRREGLWSMAHCSGGDGRGAAGERRETVAALGLVAIWRAVARRRRARLMLNTHPL